MLFGKMLDIIRIWCVDLIMAIFSGIAYLKTSRIPPRNIARKIGLFGQNESLPSGRVLVVNNNNFGNLSVIVEAMNWSARVNTIFPGMLGLRTLCKNNHDKGSSNI